MAASGMPTSKMKRIIISFFAVKYFSLTGGKKKNMKKRKIMEYQSACRIINAILMGLLPNWLWLQFPSFGCAKFVNRRHTLSQVCLLFSHLARAKSENFASKLIRQQALDIFWLDK